MGFAAATVLGAPPALAQEGAGAGDVAELASKLSNPIASLVSVPIKYSWDTGIGALDADRSTLVIQPVIPISIGDDWNLVNRTIIPFIDMQAPFTGGNDESGLGDINQSFFFSPKAPTPGGWIWGAGLVMLYPSGGSAVGGEKWGAGPTAVLLKQDSGWTYGILANHIWSFAGEDARADINATFLQPFVSYGTRQGTTLSLNTESTYDWTAREWTVPINLSVSQLVRIGHQPVSFAAAGRYYADKPAGGPDWGLSFTFTLLFPTKAGR
jgi:hypothetical protein